MANSYNWIISNLDAKIEDQGKSDVINTIHWRYVATDESGDYTKSMYGTYSVSYESGDSFIEYADLSKDDVVGWLEEGLDVEEMKSNLDSQIDREKNPVSRSLNPDWD